MTTSEIYIGEQIATVTRTHFLDLRAHLTESDLRESVADTLGGGSSPAMAPVFAMPFSIASAISPLRVHMADCVSLDHDIEHRYTAPDFL